MIEREVEFVKKRLTFDATSGSKREVYALIGVRGAMTFVYADWTEFATAKERAIDTEFLIKFGHPLYPMGYGVDRHARKRLGEYDSHMESCDILDGKECFGDGSALAGQTLLREWIEADRDDSVIWATLREFYDSWLIRE